MKRWTFACAAILMGFVGSPAMAGPDADWLLGRPPFEWYITHGGIYALQNEIALLQAKPEADDDFKAPIIARARADILRLRATIEPAQWRWPAPCCYSRRPIYLR